MNYDDLSTKYIILIIFLIISGISIYLGQYPSEKPVYFILLFVAIPVSLNYIKDNHYFKSFIRNNDTIKFNNNLFYLINKYFLKRGGVAQVEGGVAQLEKDIRESQDKVENLEVGVIKAQNDLNDAINTGDEGIIEKAKDNLEEKEDNLEENIRILAEQLELVNKRKGLMEREKELTSRLDEINQEFIQAMKNKNKEAAIKLKDEKQKIQKEIDEEIDPYLLASEGAFHDIFEEGHEEREKHTGEIVQRRGWHGGIFDKYLYTETGEARDQRGSRDLEEEYRLSKGKELGD